MKVECFKSSSVTFTAWPEAATRARSSFLLIDDSSPVLNNFERPWMKKVLNRPSSPGVSR